MPYATNDELPPAVKNRYSERCQSVFRRVFNDTSGSEETKFKVAHTAAGNCMNATKGTSAKAMVPVKAQEMDSEEMTAWYQGRTSRRLLVIPFGGPLASPKAPKGVDLDGEWFSERTNLYGPYKALRDTKERPTDFMHGQDATMKRSIIGITELDDEPEEDGLWARVWLKAQQARLALFEKLGGVLYGSSEAVYKKADPDTGEILEWPYWRQTLAPTPQNIWSVMRPYKAALDEADSAGIELASPLKAWLADLDALQRGPSADLPLGGDAAATATRLTERMPDLLEAWGIRKQ